MKLATLPKKKIMKLAIWIFVLHNLSFSCVFYKAFFVLLAIMFSIYALFIQ